MKLFGTARQIIFDGKSWHNPLKHKIFRYPKLMTHRKVYLRNFSALWDKKFSTKNHDPPPLIDTFFSLPEYFVNTAQKNSPMKLFGTARQIISDGKSWHNPLKHKIFRYPKLMTHRKVYLRNFSALWDKKFWTENHDPPPLIHIFFRYRNFSWTQHRRVPLQSFSAPWEKKISTENFDTPPSYP